MSTRDGNAVTKAHLSSTHSNGRPEITASMRFRIDGDGKSTSASSRSSSFLDASQPDEHNDAFNYALLIALYTLQGIPMGLSASIPFLIQQKVKQMTVAAASMAAGAAATQAPSAAAAAHSAAVASRLSYNANAVFALCSWPFSLKLLWAPIVDAVFFKGFGRRKSWLVPVQTLAGVLMVLGANFVERQLGLGDIAIATERLAAESSPFNVKGVTAFFFALYFLMATQDIAVDGWALTMLSKKNRGRGPVCNSIGQNIGYFLSFVGFLALNDAESSETLWRPLLGLKSNPEVGLVSLGSFIRFMGYFMIATTTAVAIFKREEQYKGHARVDETDRLSSSTEALLASDRLKKQDGDEEDAELDASEIGLKETYHRLWAVCKLPAVRWLFLILFTYRLPTALSDNVKFLKAVEFGLSKSTTALLSPTVILPLGILVPIIATKVWHGHPLRQFMTAYKARVTLVPLLDVLMLLMLQRGKPKSATGLAGFWILIVLSTAAQAIVNSLQFNAQMTFFAHRVDPAIGGSYMTLLNTAANLGGTWPASFVMWLVSRLTQDETCSIVTDPSTGLASEVCSGGRDPFFVLQALFSLLGVGWILVLGKRVRTVASLPDDAWRSHVLDGNTNKTKNVYDDEALSSVDVELGGGEANRWEPKDTVKDE